MQEIIGIVIDKKYDKKDIELRVKWVEKNININIICQFYCPAKKNDTIYAECAMLTREVEGKQVTNYVVTKLPMLLIAKDKNTIISNISTALNLKYPEAVQLYNDIVVIATSENQVYDYMTSLAQDYADYKTPSILTLFGPNPHDYDMKLLLEHFHKDFNLRQLYLLGLNNKEIRQSGKCKDIFNKCIQNPYVVYAIPIEKADEILGRMKRQPDIEQREKGEIMRLIGKNVADRKWYCTPTYHFKKFPKFRSYLDSLKTEYGLVIDLNCAYIDKYYKMENYIADYFIKMIKSDPVTVSSPIDVPFVGANGVPFIRYKATFSPGLSEDQQVAVQAALDHCICLISGAGGCGKSYVIGEIIKNLDERNLKYCLTSYTGKAVSNIRTITGKKCAATMHRLINNAKQLPLNNDVNNYDYVIIDEISMVNTTLLYDFLIIHPNIKQLVMVGDVNQLEPISEGNLLSELIKAKCVPTYYLTTNYRFINSGGNDGIIKNTMAILNHQPEYPFEFIDAPNFKIIKGNKQTVFELVQILKDRGVDVNDLVVITPYAKDLRIKQRNTLCIDELNQGVQNIYNQHSFGLKDSRGIMWKINDRVILTKNSPVINTYNGQPGIITDVTKEHVKVDFGVTGEHKFLMEPKNKTFVEDSEEDYNDELSVLKLDHSYCLTVHKSQGDQRQIVIFYLQEDTKDSSFFNKHMSYTGISRAREDIYIITSDINVLCGSISRSSAYKCENLATRLSALPKIEPFKLKTKIDINHVEPIIDDPDLQYYMNQNDDDYYDD